MSEPKREGDYLGRLLGFVLGFAVAATMIVVIVGWILSKYW
jgi:hypothetical protein